MTFTRRRFLLTSTAALAAAGAGVYFGTRLPLSGLLLSAYEDARGDQHIGGIDLRSQRLFGAVVPMRAHGCDVDPRDPNRVLFFARRPGTQAFELRLDAGHARSVFTTPPGRHLAGHGLFSYDGQWLFTPEHDYEHTRGVIAVRDTRDFRVVAELSSGGLDPHEIAWAGSELLVANGGIMTHPRSYRRKLNIATMDPSLCLLDAASGACKEQWRLPDHLLSIRHLAIANSTEAFAGLQYEGDAQHAPGIVAHYRKGMGLRLLPMPAAELRASNGYVASVSVDGPRNLAFASCPRGRGVASWRFDRGEFVRVIPAAEAYGVSQTKNGVPLASQRDGTTLCLTQGSSPSVWTANAIHWDDHWRWHEDAVTVAA
jgi:uncharacterized protein